MSLQHGLPRGLMIDLKIRASMGRLAGSVGGAWAMTLWLSLSPTLDAEMTQK